MANFRDIYATTPMPFKVRCQNGETATCDGNRMTWDASGALVSAVQAATYEWELVTEPTVESVLRERGYCQVPHGGSIDRIEPRQGGFPEFRFQINKAPATVELATAICDLLDKLK
jgi:hypothetical protein